MINGRQNCRRGSDLNMQGNAFFFAWEEQVLLFLQSFMGGVWQRIAEFFSLIGEELVPVAIVAFVYWCLNKQLGKRIAFSVTLTSLGFPMIKNIVLRLRPYMVNHDIVCLKLPVKGADPLDVTAQGYSFPSGHSAMAAGTYGAIGSYVRKNWAWCLAVILPLLIGISRLCLGVHYPTDIMAGWAVGAIGVGLTVLMEKFIPKEMYRFAVLFVIALPGVFYCQSEDYFSALGLLIGFAAGLWFEQRYVRFSVTRRPLIMLLRTVAGLLIYLGVSAALKALFGVILGAAGPAALAGRVIRYALCVFLLVGPYPMLFTLLDKWLPARGKAV